MGGAEWSGAIALLKSWLVHQPAPTPIAILLAAAFLLVMFIEGLRASFLPARRTSENAPPLPQEPARIAPPSGMPRAPRDGAPSRAVQRFVPKQQAAPVRAYGAPRPGIHHRIKLETVTITAIERSLPVADRE